MKTKLLNFKNGFFTLVISFAISSNLNSQTTVFDVISGSPNHSSLAAAINTANLTGALQDVNATYTVFAPDNNAFDNLALQLGTNISGLLALPNLSDILLYHVLDISVDAASVTNGLIAQPLNNANTIKLTKTFTGNVYANHAIVNAADLQADNGIVHSIDKVILSDETVVDIAIDNGFTTLATAVITAELLPALTDPFASFTVFAPDNNSFDQLAVDLGTDLNGILTLPNLTDILLYHVLDASVDAASVSNGLVAQPLSTTNTIKMTKTQSGVVYANQAKVVIPDLSSSNGIVHTLDAVILPNETVVDIAIDNNFSALTTAVITAELLPVLTKPLGSFTVFAPTDNAFNDLATSLNTDINGILNLPNLSEILLYHTVAGIVMSSDLVSGPVTTIEGTEIFVDLSSGVIINDANVTSPDITADNGVVHVIDKVLLSQFASIETINEDTDIRIYPNPASSFIDINIDAKKYSKLFIINPEGKIIIKHDLKSDQTRIDVKNLIYGSYLIKVMGDSGEKAKKIFISNK